MTQSLLSLPSFVADAMNVMNRRLPIALVLSIFASLAAVASADEPVAPAAPLIETGRIELKLAGAETIVAAARAKAVEGDGHG